MAKKITLNDLDKKIDTLTAIVEKSFGAIAEDIDKLATKEQLAALHTQVTSIEQQLREGRYEVRLGNLEAKVFGAPRRHFHSRSRRLRLVQRKSMEEQVPQRF